jgi:hypothetical protein
VSRYNWPLLDFVRRRRIWAWTGLIAYAAAVTLPHEQVQLIVGRIADRITLKGVYRASAALALAEVAVLTLLLAWRLAVHPERRRIGAYWILTVALICATWVAFTANATELIHYPQYFPEGAALMAMTLSPAESLAWVALLGGVDEGYQYWVLYPRRVSSFDFNDIYMDLLGGAAGVVFAMAFFGVRRNGGWWKRPGVATLAAATVVLGMLSWSGLIRLSRQNVPFWSIMPALGPHHVHELSPIEGVVLIAATIALYAPYARRKEFGTPPRTTIS